MAGHDEPIVLAEECTEFHVGFGVGDDTGGVWVVGIRFDTERGPIMLTLDADMASEAAAAMNTAAAHVTFQNGRLS